MGKILLLEDDKSLNRGISFKLKKEGFEVETAFCIGEAKNIFESVIGDNNKYIESGANTLAKYGYTSETSYLIDKSENKVKMMIIFFVFLFAVFSIIILVIAIKAMGYEIGADDYVTKPFSLAILVSKVKAFMKRAGNDEKEKTSENILISEDIEFDYGDYTLILNREDTEKVQLTKTEGKLLKLLMENAMNIIQKVLNREDTEKVQLTKTEGKLLKLLMENAMNIIQKEQILDILWDMDGNFF